MRVDSFLTANCILKDYLVKGYSFNKKKLNEQARQLDALKQTARFVLKQNLLRLPT